MKGLSDFVTNPNIASDVMAKSFSGLNSADPDVARSAQQQGYDAAKALLEFAPKKDSSDSPFESDTGRYTNGQVSDFARKLHVALNPLSVMEELEAGTFDPGAISVLEAMYPTLLSKMQAAILERAAEKKRSYSYSQKLNLSLLYGKEVDSAGQPRNIQALQKNFAKERDEKTEMARKTGTKSSLAKDSETTAQRLESR